jgi:hypothetical protein
MTATEAVAVQPLIESASPVGRSRADASAARAAALTVIANAEIGGDFAGDGRWARQVTWV